MEKEGVGKKRWSKGEGGEGEEREVLWFNALAHCKDFSFIWV